ncbi:MAG: sulfatase-like hydrolase/transferase [Bacteroidaceae bacterium]|nr:sulfatase-like hydrolase/transferase [Bacteroidaceae bacterium]
MKRRFLFYVKAYLAFLIVFLAVKPVFFAFNATPFSWTYFAQNLLPVLCHGFRLDLSTAGYLMAVPLLVCLFSVWTKGQSLWRKVLLAYFAVVALLLAVILAVDCSLYSFWGFKIDATIFNYMNDPANVTNSVSTAYLLTGVAAILLLGTLIFLLLRWTWRPKWPAVQHRWAATLCLLLMGGVTFLFVRGGVGKATMNIGTVYFSQDQYVNHSAVNPVFSLLASTLKTEKFDKMYRFFPQDEADSLYAQACFSTESINPTPLLKTLRPNIILIIMEGFAGTFVEPLGGTAGITPHFNQLWNEGVAFTQFYANSYRTDRGTVSILSGYQGFPKLSPMKMPEKSRTLGSVAGILAQAGYRTEFLYGGDINFTNTKSFLMANGYQTVIGDSHFPHSVRRTHSWGVTDAITFDTLSQRVLQHRDTIPWMTTFLTLASHEDWQVPYHRDGLSAKENAMAYVDDCLGRFVGRMKETPLWDNLLIICLPDHGIGYPEGISEADARRYHVPLLWLGGAVAQPVKIDRICAQSDLLATLMGQLGLDHASFPLSRDVMSQDYDYPCALHTFDNGLTFIDSTGYTVLDLTSGRTLADSPRPMPHRERLGRAILQKSMEDWARR